MTLPHRINITSGGTGADAGEMFFGDQVDRVDGPPGAGSRGLSPGEDALSKNFNRAAFALAQNDEYLGDIVVKKDIAVVEVGALTAWTGNNIKIDPSGGLAGDVNYTGTLYLGDAGWPASQENLDTLFQVLDSNYNEIIIDGVEVKVTSIQAPRAVGQGFVALITQLNLNKTLPSGNYRIAYGRGRTYETLPAYGLIRADVRGLHEAPGEAQKRAYVVCDYSGALPADFVGNDALPNAIAYLTPLGGGTIYMRQGVYNPTVNITVPSKVTIIGDGEDMAQINLLTNNKTMTISGDKVSISNLSIITDTGVDVSWTGDNGTLKRVFFYNGGLALTGCNIMSLSDIMMENDNCIITATSCTELSIDGLRLTHSGMTNKKGLVFSTTCINFSVRNSVIEADGSSPVASGDGTALYFGTGTYYGSFVGCSFRSKSSAVFSDSPVNGEISFSGCNFAMTNGLAANAQNEFVRLVLTNRDSRCTLSGCSVSTSNGDWVGNSAGQQFALFQNVDAIGTSISFYSMNIAEAAPDDVDCIEIRNSVFDDLYIFLPEENNAGGGASGILKIGPGGVVRNLYWDSLSTEHTIPVVYMEGDLDQKAILENAVFVGSVGFSNTTTALLVGTGPYSTVRGVRWDSSVDTVPTNKFVIGLENAGVDLYDVLIEECDLENSDVNQKWESVIVLYGNKGDELRVDNNKIVWNTDKNYLPVLINFRAINVQSFTALSAVAPASGFQRCSVSGNHIELSKVQGDIALLVPTIQHIRVNSNVVLSKVDHNVCSALFNPFIAGANLFMSVLSADIGAGGVGGAGGNTTYGNVLIDKTNPAIGAVPDIELDPGPPPATAPPGHAATVKVQW